MSASGEFSAILDEGMTSMQGSLPRLLSGIDSSGPLGLQAHVSTHGPLPEQRDHPRRSNLQRDPRQWRKGKRSMLIDEVELSGLRGRGGGAFPTAKKMRAVLAARGDPIVVVNAAEGEPASAKDKLLLGSTPHLVLDGAVLAASALGADEAIVCVCEAAESAIWSASEAIEERKVFGGDRVKLSLVAVPQGYVASQESALVSFLNGGPAKPLFTSPPLFERGLGRRPTFVSNAETFAQLALIARGGAEWFRTLGTRSEPGSALVSLNGPVGHPGVYEIEYGTSLASLIEAAGGLQTPVRAVLFGGYGGSWVDGRALQGLTLSDEGLKPHGASFGPGVIVLLEQASCPVAELVTVARWLADQSAGQCGPCSNGLPAMAQTLEDLACGRASGAPLRRLNELAGLVEGRGACAHPDGSARFVRSALSVFKQELSAHAANGPCKLCRRPTTLPFGAVGGTDTDPRPGARRTGAPRTGAPRPGAPRPGAPRTDAPRAAGTPRTYRGGRAPERAGQARSPREKRAMLGRSW